MPSFPLTNLSHPRTGKRGVPQQFPRKLFEMLESESELAQSSPDYEEIIAWSESGNAFAIIDPALFSSHILPKYFRTNKFSSFQRNLNLYGFSKVRHGPDAAMYYHPLFSRGHPETLLLLRKCKNGGNKATVSLAPLQQRKNFVHPVSPSPPSSPVSITQVPLKSLVSSFWASEQNQQLAPRPMNKVHPTDNATSSVGGNKLSLLALAMISVEAAQLPS